MQTPRPENHEGAAMIDRIVGGIFILIAAAALGRALLAVPFAADPVGPRVFPIIVATTLGLWAITICVRPGQITLEFGDWRRVIAILAAAIIYPFSSRSAGLHNSHSASLLCERAGIQGARPAGCHIGLGHAVFFFVMLDMLLDLPLPRGPLGI